MPPKRLRMRAEKKNGTEKVYANILRQVMGEESEPLVMEDLSDISLTSALEPEMEAESQHLRQVQHLTALLTSIMETSCQSCSCCAKVADILQRAKDSDGICDKSASSDNTLVSSTSEKNTRQLTKKNRECCQPQDAQNRTNTHNLDGMNSKPKIKNSSKERTLFVATVPGEKASDREASRLNDPKSPLTNTSDLQDEIMEKQTTQKSRKRMEKKISTNRSKMLKAGTNQHEAATKNTTYSSERHNDISERSGAKNQSITQNVDISNTSQSKIKKSKKKRRALYTLPFRRTKASDRKDSKLNNLKSPLAITLNSEDDIMVNKTAPKTQKRKENKISSDESETGEARSNQPKTSSKIATEAWEGDNDISERNDTENQANIQPKVRRGKKRSSTYTVSVPKKKAAHAKVRTSDPKSPQVSTLNSESEITENAAKPRPNKPTGNKLSAKKKQNLVGVEISQTTRSQLRTKKVDSLKKQSVKSVDKTVDGDKNATGKAGKGATNYKKGQNSSSEDLVSHQLNNIVANIRNELYTISVDTESKKTRNQIAKKLARRAGSSLHDSVLTESINANPCSKRLYSDEAWRNSKVFEVLCKQGEENC